jgi:hypothetical protein
VALSAPHVAYWHFVGIRSDLDFMATVARLLSN